MCGERDSTIWSRFVRANIFLLPLYALVSCLLFVDRPPARETPPPPSRAILEECGVMSQGLLADSGLGNADERGEVKAASAERGEMEDYLLSGDILLGRCRLSLVPSLDPTRGWTHAALYVGDGDIVVASNPSQGVVRASVKAWEHPKMTWVVCLRVVSATEEERKEAAEFAVRNIGRPYDLNWFAQQQDGDNWYCSELVWAAYLHATQGRVNLESGLRLFGVSPDDIYRHRETTVVGGHYERKPDTVLSLLAKAFALCAMFGVAAVIVRDMM